MSRFFLALAVLLLLSSPSWGETDQTPTAGATRFVESLSNDVLRVSRTVGITAEQRDVALRRVLERGLDLAVISRFVLGRHWASASPEQLSEYQRLFSDYLVGAYAKLLQKHRVESFAVTSADDLGLEHTKVRSQIVLVGGESVEWSWRVREFDGQYRVIDLFANGVSMAVTFRSEFGSVVANYGLDALLESLRMRTGRSQAALESAVGLIPVAASLAASGELLALKLRN